MDQAALHLPRASDVSPAFDALPPLSFEAQAPSRQVSLAGLCSVEGSADVTCLATEISSDRLVVGCRAKVPLGAKVIFSFTEFGLLEALVIETFENGFVARFEPAPDSKLSIYLAWLGGAPEPVASPTDRRAEERITPVRKLTTLRIADEPENMARVIDLSRSSVAFTTSRSLAEGEPVALGARTGKVARVFEGGAAVELDRQIDEDEFNPMIDLRNAEGPG